MSNPKPNTLVDSFQRQISYLRLSVTDRCNLRCRYCAPAMPQPKAMQQLLTLEEMHRLVRIGTSLGIAKVRLTGGEPLCRKDLSVLIDELSHMPRIKDISMTTNGTLLSRHARQLKSAGLRRINISLDTLDRSKFHQLTGADQFEDVWKGIMTAAEEGFEPIKINTVVMKGFNDGELEQMARLAMRYPFHIRFIEYMPIGTDPFRARNLFIPVADIKKRLRRMGKLLPVAGDSIDGPAQRFRFEGAPGEIGLIGSMSTHFCALCNRLRLTADGYLRACLLADDQVDVITPMRRGASDKSLEALFVRTISQKKAEHRMSFISERRLQTKMVSIGG